MFKIKNSFESLQLSFDDLTKFVNLWDISITDEELSCQHQKHSVEPSLTSSQILINKSKTFTTFQSKIFPDM